MKHTCNPRPYYGPCFQHSIKAALRRLLSNKTFSYSISLYQVLPHGLIPQSLPAHDPRHVFTPCRRHAPGQAAASGYLPWHRYQASRDILFAADCLHGDGLCRCMECYDQSQFFFPHILHPVFPVPGGAGTTQ